MGLDPRPQVAVELVGVWAICSPISRELGDPSRQFAQRMGADTIEVATGHCAMVSHSEEMLERIVTASNAVALPGGSAPRPPMRG